jgi:anti-sigma regulatory factor (Ser/Thr protein kinase)
LAVNEAVTNVVEHAYPRGEALTVRATASEVALGDGSRHVLIVITDRGLWRPAPFDPGDRGRGIPMMRAIAHSLHIEPSTRGTRVTITSRPVPSALDSTI